METKNKKNKVNLFLDSGAYSAWSQQLEINIHEYIAFIKKNKQYIDVYANLDVISSNKGKKKISPKQAAEGTLRNQRIMEKAGLNPLPCYHFGEPIKYLKKYLKEYDYVALGGMVPISNKDLKPWLDDLYREHICDKKGIPKVKIHGFGMTSLTLMLRYPWWSVDSTSWVVTGRMGGILIPRQTKGEYDYSKNPIKLTVSDLSPSTKKLDAHYNTFSPVQQKIFREYFEGKGFKLGKSTYKKQNSKTYILKENKVGDKQKYPYEKWNTKKKGIVETVIEPGISNDYKLRDELNIMYFIDLEREMPKWPWAFKIKPRMKSFF